MRERTPTQHGYGGKPTLLATAKHEAGHAFMLWLLDQYLGGVYACGQGGMAQRVLIGKDTLVLPSQHLLYLLAGMVMSCDWECIKDLRDHVDTPDYFAKETDSFLAATLVHAFKAPPLVVFINHEVVISRLRHRIARPFNEMLNLLLHRENHILDFKELYEMTGRWDVEYGFDKRPKSDYVMRTLARECRVKVPKCKWLGWNMKPLKNWEYKRPTLMELAMKIMVDMEERQSGKNSEDIFDNTTIQQSGDQNDKHTN
jgi:hypothetical protein